MRKGDWCNTTGPRTSTEEDAELPFAFATRLTKGRMAAGLLACAPECVAAVCAAMLAAVFAYGFGWRGAVAAFASLGVCAPGLVMYRAGARAVRQTREAEAATAGIRRLCELTRGTLELNLHQEPGARLASLVYEIFGLDGVAIFDADLQEVYTAGRWAVDPLELVQNVYHFETSDDDGATGISRRVIRLGSVPIGSMVVRGESTPLANHAIAALIAITFDRYRALANESRIEAEREVEKLRATVLDSLAHDFKTPLTAIRAASSGLAEMGRLSAAQAELVNLIDEQATSLADLTTRLLTTAQLDSEEGGEGSAGVTLQLGPEPVDSLIEEAVNGLAEHSAGQRIKVELPPEPFVVECDRRLLGMLLAQYLDNACKYAELDSTITVRAERSGDEVVLSVHSFGPVIPLADRERIFDRYYRSSASSSQAAGTGIGLSIAKRAALAHGGSVWVSSDEMEGNTFFAAFPARTGAAPRATIAALERSIS
jgi:two-component system sensor histidine kinase KdpD